MSSHDYDIEFRPTTKHCNADMLSRLPSCKIYNAPIPANVKELQSFIGGVNYYAKFIPDMAKICKPLYKLLQKDIVWSWQNEQERAFHILKSKLTSAPVLAVYDKKLRIKLDCDASKYGVGHFYGKQ